MDFAHELFHELLFFHHAVFRQGALLLRLFNNLAHALLARIRRVKRCYHAFLEPVVKVLFFQKVLLCWARSANDYPLDIVLIDKGLLDMIRYPVVVFVQLIFSEPLKPPCGLASLPVLASNARCYSVNDFPPVTSKYPDSSFLSVD